MGSERLLFTVYYMSILHLILRRKGCIHLGLNYIVNNIVRPHKELVSSPLSVLAVLIQTKCVTQWNTIQYIPWVSWTSWCLVF